MQALQFDFPKPPPTGLLDALCEKLPYCSESIASFEIGRDGILFHILPDASATDVRRAVSEFYAQLSAGFLPMTPNVLIDDRRPFEHRTCQSELLAKRWIVPFADGCVALQGPALALYEYVDQTVRSIGHQLDARDAAFPTLISIETLNRCGYLASFPHHITVASRLVGNAERIAAFSESVQNGAEQALDSCARPDHVLSPTVCIHCYQSMAGCELEAGEVRVIGARGNCFRHELGRLDHATRLWDFNMREIICVGERAGVLGSRQQIVVAIVEWLRSLGLSFWIEGAADPFFVDRYSRQYFFQLANKTKYELRMSAPETAMAVGSFNVHQDFFGQAFDIRQGGGHAHTSCFGVGLERMVYAILAQIGTAIDEWPEPLRLLPITAPAI